MAYTLNEIRELNAINDYRLVIGDTALKFETAVSDLIHVGWQCLGPPTITYLADEQGFRFHQAMLRTTEAIHQSVARKFMEST